MIIAAIAVWVLLAALSLLLRLRRGRAGANPGRRRIDHLIGLAAAVVGSAVVAVLAALAGPADGVWTWVGYATAAVAAVLVGGSATTDVLALADAATQSASVRVQQQVLRGGAWIGALERLAIVGTLLAGWPEGIGAVVAIKGLARFPELRASASSGATERFIIGTLSSLLWAAGCAGIAALVVH